MTADAPHEAVLQAHAHRMSGRFADAIDTLTPLLAAPDTPPADRVLALDIAAYSSLAIERVKDAERLWREALDIAPEFIDACSHLGIMLKGLGRLDEAEPLLRRFVNARPDAADTRFHLASLLFRLGRYDEAEAEYRHVLRVLPDAADAHNNLGNVLEVLGRRSEAEAHIRRALALNPALAHAHYNLGSLARQAGRLDEAESAYRRALGLRDDYDDASLGLATLLLSTGRFDEGWTRYEARYDYAHFVHSTSRALLQCAQWQGESLAGKSVLVWQEDGLGDMIQFARYLPLLKAAGARSITIGCVSALHRLFARIAEVDAVLDHDTAQARSADFDVWTSLLSAPLHFHTTIDTIPEPLHLRADAGAIEAWRPTLDPLAGAFKIGLVWKGNPLHHNDANRSLPSLATLSPLWSVPNVRFVSLQKGDSEASHPPDDQPLLDVGASVADLADSAAIIAQLDLVICVDTSIAHLAASLGKACWILLPAYDTDWRWMHDRDDSPWYPGIVRLFRQQPDEAWHGVIERVAQALRARAITESETRPAAETPSTQRSTSTGP